MYLLCGGVESEQLQCGPLHTAITGELHIHSFIMNRTVISATWQLRTAQLQVKLHHTENSTSCINSKKTALHYKL